MWWIRAGRFVVVWIDNSSSNDVLISYSATFTIVPTGIIVRGMSKKLQSLRLYSISLCLPCGIITPKTLSLPRASTHNAATTLEDYYNQQKNNDYFSDNGKRLICRVIENCQKIVNDIFLS